MAEMESCIVCVGEIMMTSEAPQSNCHPSRLPHRLHNLLADHLHHHAAAGAMYCCSALTMSCHPPPINTHPPAHVPRDISPSSTKQLHPSLLPHRLPQPPIRPPSPSCRRWRRRNAASLASCPLSFSFPRLPFLLHGPPPRLLIITS